MPAEGRTRPGSPRCSSRCPASRCPANGAGRGHVWHQYTIRVTEEAGISRDELAAKLTERGVGSGIYYPKLVFDYDAYRGNPQVRASDVPVAQKLTEQVLSLPVHAALADADLDRVADTVAGIVDSTHEPRKQIILVGAGSMGSHHARVISQSESADLAVLVDPREDVGRAVAERFGATWRRELPDLDSYDAVVIAAATEAHYELAVQVLGQDRPLLIEKPVADSLLRTRGDPRPGRRAGPAHDVRAAGALQPRGHHRTQRAA